MNVRMVKKIMTDERAKPHVASPSAAVLWGARQEYEVVVDTTDGEPVRVVTSVEWDDERKALVLTCD